VEHPITEMITNLDLVEWQLLVAAGNRVPKKQDEIKINGWAFEARVYAENPANQFLPDTGTIKYLQTPETSATVRIDSSIRQGDAVSVFYDPMIAKLIVHGKDRTSALAKLSHSLDLYKVVGLNTNVEFLKSLSTHPEFIAGNVETGFIGKYSQDLLIPLEIPSSEAVISAVIMMLTQSANAIETSFSDPWTQLSRFRLNSSAEEKVTLDYQGTKIQVSVEQTQGLMLAKVEIPKQPMESYQIDPASISFCKNTNELSMDVGSKWIRTTVVPDGDSFHVFANGTGCNRPTMGSIKHTFKIPEPKYVAESRQGEDEGTVRTPMPCKIVQIMVQPNSKVTKGQPLVVLESMKMEHVIRSPQDGVIAKLYCKLGEMAEANRILLEFEDHKSS
jgi:3-methylcrotonyl-CoA carboxylase alpha subunit